MVWPEPNSTAAGNRMLQLINALKKFDYKITFASTASSSEFMYNVNSIGVSTFAIKLNDVSFDEFITTLNPTIVIFDRYIIEEQFGWRVTENCPNALKILDTIDLHCLRLARQKVFKENKLFTNDDLISDFSKREIASIYRCDITLMISEYEMNLLKNYFKIPNSLLLYLPFMLENLSLSKTNAYPTYENRNHFISIGNFLHEPNWSAVQYLKDTIWPLIRKQLPTAQLHVYGAYPTQKVFELHNTQTGFLIKGRAKNAHDVMLEAKICLAPLQFGAGLKGKLIDAMQCGTPNITTTIGAEGMCNNLPWSGFICDNPQTFANEAVSLYNDKTEWLKAQTNGYHIINTVFNKHIFEEVLHRTVQNIFNTLTEHRNANFIGAILQHHTNQSTKFMARWIELKNKQLF